MNASFIHSESKTTAEGDVKISPPCVKPPTNKISDGGRTMSISVVYGLGSPVNSTTIIEIPIKDVEKTLKTRTDVYELTWRESDSQLCRAYIDVDGVMSLDTDEADFDSMNEAIKYILCDIDLGTPFSVMTASKYRNKDKTGEIKNKLSYHIVFTEKCGSKEAVKCWTRDVIAPKLKVAFKDTIHFNINGVEELPKDVEDYLDWDNGVYRSHGKMSMWNTSKPNENRNNTLIKGSVIDTLIGYIPPECEELPEPVQEAPKVRNELVVSHLPPPPTQPHPSELPPVPQATIVKVLEALPSSVSNSYNEWVSVGMACFNEDIPMEYWDKWSATSPKYRKGDCATKWRTFKKGNITQAYLWSLLKKHNPTAFKELLGERKDFQKLIENPSHYAVAEYFYNNRPNDYLYDTNAGWFGVMPTNIWENPKGKSHPPTIKNKIVRVLNAERLQLEGTILKKKMEATARNDSEAVESLDKITKKCLEFKDKIENDSFQKGLISFLSSFYAEQSQLLMLSKGVKETDGVIGVFDTNPNIWAFSDCLYDFTLKDFRPIDPTDYITITCGFPRPKSNPAVRAKMMETFKGIWENTEPMDYMLTLLSACLCGTRNMEVFAILTGRGGNGKGLLWEVVQRTFGGYYYQLPKQSLTKAVDSATAATPDIANLRGMRCVGTTEPEAEERLQEGTIKAFTGGDLLTGRPLYGQPFTFKPQFGIFIQCNNIPVFNGITKGGVRRNRVIPFPFNFVAEPKLSYERVGDPHIKNVLCRSDEWRDEFFNILLDYYPKAAGKQIDQIKTPAIVKERTDEYLEDNNRVGVWWADNYEQVEGQYISSMVAREALRTDTGMRMGDREFKAALAFNDIDIKKITKGELRGKMGIENWKRKDAPATQPQMTNEETQEEANTKTENKDVYPMFKRA